MTGEKRINKYKIRVLQDKNSFWWRIERGSNIVATSETYKAFQTARRIAFNLAKSMKEGVYEFIIEERSEKKKKK